MVTRPDKLANARANTKYIYVCYQVKYESKKINLHVVHVGFV